LKITPIEKTNLIDLKKYHPEYGCGMISGMLRIDGTSVSPTTCYNYLKRAGLIIPLKNRKPPDKYPKYMPYMPLKTIGLDWSYFKIANERYNLVTVIDYFSKYLLGHVIVKNVNGAVIRNLVAGVYLEQGIERDNAPMLSLDQGTPNTAKKTKDFLRDLGFKLNYGEAARPTTHAVQERFYKTWKQELVYHFEADGFYDYEHAEDLISDYIYGYNNNRPHSSIYNFVPHDAHYVYQNMSLMLSIYRDLVQKARLSRITYWEESLAA